jgi:hypothetical protein
MQSAATGSTTSAYVGQDSGDAISAATIVIGNALSLFRNAANAPTNAARTVATAGGIPYGHRTTARLMFTLLLNQ